VKRGTDLFSFHLRGKAHSYAAFRGLWTLSTNEYIGPAAERGKKGIGGDESSVLFEDPISKIGECALCLRWAAEVAAWPASEISGEAASTTLLEGRDRHVRATLQLPSFDNLEAEVLGRCKPLLTVSMPLFILSCVVPVDNDRWSCFVSKYLETRDERCGG
jgi:hypothetical protein